MLSPYLVTAYTYDPAGNEFTETLPNGVVSSYTYDDLNRLTNLTETKGSTTLFSQSFTLNADGARATSAESQLQPDSSTLTTESAWGYDADGRLVSESADSSDTDDSFTNTYAYDLDSNRMSEDHTGPGGGATADTTYAYNGDDELTSQSTGGVTTSNTYDSNGSLTSSTTGGVATTYTYDVRNKLASVTTGGVTTTYVYDDAGDRVAETTGGVTTKYLTDTANPTGYDQPLEETTGSASTPTRTYLIGDRVFGQADGSGTVSYLLADGHGSTQAITNASGAITRTFNYDAFGGALGFDLSTSGTEYLFGGDALYDAPSGLYFNGDGIRERLGFEFIERDSYAGHTQDPASLHKYLYAEADPINGRDPSGHDDDTLEDEAFGDADGDIAEDVAGYEAVNDYVTGNFGRIGAYASANFGIGDVIQNNLAVDQQAAFALAGLSEQTQRDWRVNLLPTVSLPSWLPTKAGRAT